MLDKKVLINIFQKLLKAATKSFHFNLFLTLFSHFKHNLILNEHQMRFPLFYTFIFLYWTILILGPFIN